MGVMDRFNGVYHGELISPEDADSLDNIIQINIPRMTGKIEDVIGLLAFATTRKTVVVAGKELNIEKKYPKMTKTESLVANLRKAVKSYVTRDEKIKDFIINLIPLNIKRQKDNIVILELGVELKFRNGRKRHYITCAVIDVNSFEIVVGVNLCDLTIGDFKNSGNLLFSLFKASKVFQAGEYIYANTKESRVEKMFVSLKMKGVVMSAPKTVIVQPFEYFIEPEQTVIDFIRDGDKFETHVTIFGSGVGVRTKLTEIDSPKVFSLLLALGELGKVKTQRYRTYPPDISFNPGDVNSGTKILRASFGGVSVSGMYIKKIFHCKQASMEPVVYVTPSVVVIPVEGDSEKAKAYVVFKFKDANVPVVARCVFEKTP